VILVSNISVVLCDDVTQRVEICEFIVIHTVTHFSRTTLIGYTRVERQ
jgi:hypothetical protein